MREKKRRFSGTKHFHRTLSNGSKERGKSMKKIIWLLVCLMLLCNASLAETYTTQSQGNNGPVTVEVAIDDGKIVSVNVTEHAETPGVSDKALETIPQAIVENQSVAIDVVSGASNTSNAILNAVREAIIEAGLDAAAFEGAVDQQTEIAEKELSADVVIIGAGGAGLVAALTADSLGSSVIVLDKMAFAGGNTVLSGGYYNAVDPTRQQLANIEDSIEKHITQTYEGGDKVADLALVTKLCKEAPDGLLWLESIGMRFKPEITTATGALWPRSHKAVLPNGTGYLDVYLNALADTAVQICYEVKANEIIMEDGKAVGVKATGADGTAYTVRANKGLILATGGFGSNIEMRQKYNSIWPTLDSSVGSSNTVAATGDGIEMADAVGANLVGMEYIQLHPLGNPANGNFSGVVTGDVEYYLHINKEGKRYIAEDARRDELCKAALEQTDGLMWQFTDTNDFSKIAQTAVEQGYAVTADTLEELAEKMSVDPQVLVATISEYNAAVDSGNDPFGRTILTHKFETAPFYASLRCTTVHHTMGGVQINTEAQVIDKQGNVIPGFYAAGEVTGGIHGGNRLGGNALADTVVYGRTAGRNASSGL